MGGGGLKIISTCEGHVFTRKVILFLHPLQDCTQNAKTPKFKLLFNSILNSGTILVCK